MQPFDVVPRTRIVFREGGLSLLGELVRELGCARTLLVADRGIAAAGFVDRATGFLRDAGIVVCGFHDFGANPDGVEIEAGRALAHAATVDSLVAIGGGSSLDCAKGINAVLSGGGAIGDYRGYGKVAKPMLPMIGVPTTAGTGSDAQSYAIISDPVTHEKMACGDPGMAFRVVLLDPRLSVSQPREVTAVSGYDAVSHAVESYVTSRRTAMSDALAREAWRLLNAHYGLVLDEPGNIDARGAMLFGAHQAGAAIEQSMLGATHACANPLTARYDTPHGVAIAVMLPHVVRWNGAEVGDRYAELLRLADLNPGDQPGERLAERLEAMARKGGLASRLRDLEVAHADLDALAAAAATQWTGTFNPRPFDRAAARALYEGAW